MPGPTRGRTTWRRKYRFSDNNILELFAVGAPQRHGQRLYKLNIATWDREFAASLDDYDPARPRLLRHRSRSLLESQLQLG